jgi:hypothetical protein
VSPFVQIDGARIAYLKRPFHFWKSRAIGGDIRV